MSAAPTAAAVAEAVLWTGEAAATGSDCVSSETCVDADCSPALDPADVARRRSYCSCFSSTSPAALRSATFDCGMYLHRVKLPMEESIAHTDIERQLLRVHDHADYSCGPLSAAARRCGRLEESVPCIRMHCWRRQHMRQLLRPSCIGSPSIGPPARVPARSSAPRVYQLPCLRTPRYRSNALSRHSCSAERS